MRPYTMDLRERVAAVRWTTACGRNGQIAPAVPASASSFVTRLLSTAVRDRHPGPRAAPRRAPPGAQHRPEVPALGPGREARRLHPGRRTQDRPAWLRPLPDDDLRPAPAAARPDPQERSRCTPTNPRPPRRRAEAAAVPVAGAADRAREGEIRRRVGANTAMARAYAWPPRGKRARLGPGAVEIVHGGRALGLDGACPAGDPGAARRGGVRDVRHRRPVLATPPRRRGDLGPGTDASLPRRGGGRASGGGEADVALALQPGLYTDREAVVEGQGHTSAGSRRGARIRSTCRRRTRVRVLR